MSHWRGSKKCRAATAKLEPLKGHPDPAIQELARALHLVAFGVQEIALALTDVNRENDLPF